MPAAHPPELRRRALDLVRQGNPVAKTARDLGISQSCLRNWMNHDPINAARKSGVTTDEHKKLVELRFRNCVLELKIDILACRTFASDGVGSRTPRRTRIS
ncbi:Transposase [Propionibacterium cyclohexanicum]|uniref:Transposase n=2 Tax=Propionibacterium cyclohexanicum TaxID=64702 RepID=A0A1H9U4R1_9ACTN|nr:Transposase [Propionibacterium cyclohexanicum]